MLCFETHNKKNRGNTSNIPLLRYRERTVRNSYCLFSCIHEVLIFSELQVWFPLEKLFHNFRQNETHNISLLAYHFCAKKNSNLRNYSQMSFWAKLHYSACLQIYFCAISLFPLRKKVFIKNFNVKVFFFFGGGVLKQN